MQKSFDFSIYFPYGSKNQREGYFVMLDIKRLTERLAKARDEILKDEKISKENKEILESLLFEPATVNQEQSSLSKSSNNNNRILTDDQHYRLRLIEKTGTGSNSIH